MSTTLCTFRIHYPRGAVYQDEGPAPRLVVGRTESGIEKVRHLDTTPPFIVPAANLILNGKSGHAYSDWYAFRRDTLEWGVGTCLFKARHAAHRQVDGESLGTAAGGGGETFTTAKKFLNADTLVVYVDGVTQTLTTDYSLSGNNTAPTITTTASFDTGAVTADYEFYYQVYIRQNGVSQLDPDIDLNDQGPTVVAVSIIEERAGGHLA